MPLRDERVSAAQSTADLVLDCVQLIPRGHVMSYGDVAEFIGRGSGRVVGRVLALEGAGVPWHRVVRADGTCAPHVREEQLARLRADAVPMRGQRVDMARARWNGEEVALR